MRGASVYLQGVLVGKHKERREPENPRERDRRINWHES
jgi:hypothetical protein